MNMSTFRDVLLWCYALCFVATAATTPLIEPDVTDTKHWKETESQTRHVRDIKRPSCVITIPEDEADGLTKLLNEFINVFSSKSEPTAADSPWNKTSSFVLNCTTGISKLEPSVWLILNRVWLATSCQYSDEEYDEAIRKVEDEGDKVLNTLINVDVRLRNDTIKKGYYQGKVNKVKIILEQTIKKMSEVHGMGRCDSSGVKNLTENFEEALGEIKSQKSDTASLHEETREALGTTKALKEEMDKTLKILMTRGGELEEYKTKTSQLIQKQAEQIRNQAGLLEKLNAKIFPRSALLAYQTLGWAGLSGRAVNLENVDYKGEFLYLARNPTGWNASVKVDGATLAVGEERLGESAFLWEFVPLPEEGKSSFYLRNKLREQKPLASKQGSDSGRWNYISLEIVSSPEGAQPNQLLVYMKPTVDNKYYYHPSSPPNTNSVLNGREIGRDSSRSRAGSEWIVHFAP